MSELIIDMPMFFLETEKKHYCIEVLQGTPIEAALYKIKKEIWT